MAEQTLGFQRFLNEESRANLAEVGGPTAPIPAAAQLPSTPPPDGTSIAFNRFMSGDFKAEANDFVGSDVSPGVVPTPEQAELQRLQGQGVDIAVGGPFDARLELSLTAPERQNHTLNQLFPLGFRKTILGPVVKIDSGDGVKEVLLDERGLAFNDLADVGSFGLEAISAVGGGAAVLGAFPALVASAWAIPIIGIVAGISGQTGAGIVEVMQAFLRGGIDLNKKEDIDMLGNLVERRGKAAAVDSVLDMLTVGGIRVGKAVAQKIRSPLASRVEAEPQASLLAAAERQGVDLSPGAATGSPTLQRGEAFAERFPGSSPIIESATARETQQLRVAQDRFVGEDVPTAENLGHELLGELRNEQRFINEALDAGKTLEQKAIDEIKTQTAEKLQTQADDLAARFAQGDATLNTAGDMVRTQVDIKHTAFKAKQGILEEALDDSIKLLPGESKNFISTKGLKNAAKSLLKQIPKKTVKTEELVPDVILGSRFVKTETVSPIKAFASGDETKFLASIIKDLPDNVSPAEMRKIREMLNAGTRQETLFPGISVGAIRKLSSTATTSLHAGIKNAPSPEVGKALSDTLAHYRKNILPFQSPAATSLLKSSTTAGARTGGDALPNLILNARRGNKAFSESMEIINLTGRNSVALEATRFSVIQEMIERSRNPLYAGNIIEAKKLEAFFREMPEEMRGIIFKGRQNEAEKIINNIAAQQGLIDLSALKNIPVDKDIVDTLRDLAQRESLLQNEFEAMIKTHRAGSPLLQDTNPEVFVSRAMSLPPADLRDFYRKLTPEQQAGFKQRVSVEMLSKAAKKIEPKEKSIAFVAEEGAVGTNLADEITAGFGPTPQESISKLKIIYTPDEFQTLKDLGILQLLRAQRRSAAQAVGGLAAGSAISQIITLSGLGTMGKIIKFNLAARLLGNKVTRDWLKSTKKFKSPTRRSIAFQAALPQINRVIGEMGLSAEESQDILDKFKAEFGGNKKFSVDFIPPEAEPAPRRNGTNDVFDSLNPTGAPITAEDLRRRFPSPNDAAQPNRVQPVGQP